MNNELETQAADAEMETSALNLADDTSEAEVNTEAEQVDGQEDTQMESGNAKEAETDSEAVRLQRELEAVKAQVKREKDRYNGTRADKILLAKAYNKLKEEHGFDDDEVAQELGITANDLRGRIASADAPENEAEAQVKEFNKRYEEYGFKKSLDRRFGVDTLEYVKAFEKAAQADPELMEAFTSCDPDELPDFVVERGKEVADAVGDFSFNTFKSLKEENASLRAALEKRETSTADEDLPKKDKLPMNARASGVSGASSSNLLDEVF